MLFDYPVLVDGPPHGVLILVKLGHDFVPIVRAIVAEPVAFAIVVYLRFGAGNFLLHSLVGGEEAALERFCFVFVGAPEWVFLDAFVVA